MSGFKKKEKVKMYRDFNTFHGGCMLTVEVGATGDLERGSSDKERAFVKFIDNAGCDMRAAITSEAADREASVIVAVGGKEAVNNLIRGLEYAVKKLKAIRKISGMEHKPVAIPGEMEMGWPPGVEDVNA